MHQSLHHKLDNKNNICIRFVSMPITMACHRFAGINTHTNWPHILSITGIDYAEQL